MNLEQMQHMLQNVNMSMEARDVAVKEFEAQVKAYQAETQRISAVQASMSPEQIQDIVMGTIHAAIDTGDLVAGMPEMQETPQMEQAEAPAMQAMEPQEPHEQGEMNNELR